MAVIMEFIGLIVFVGILVSGVYFLAKWAKRMYDMNRFLTNPDSFIKDQKKTSD